VWKGKSATMRACPRALTGDGDAKPAIRASPDGAPGGKPAWERQRRQLRTKVNRRQARRKSPRGKAVRGRSAISRVEGQVEGACVGNKPDGARCKGQRPSGTGTTSKRFVTPGRKLAGKPAGKLGAKASPAESAVQALSPRKGGVSDWLTMPYSAPLRALT